MSSDLDNAVARELDREREREARNMKANYLLYTIIAAFVPIVFVVIGSILWFFGHRFSWSETGIILAGLVGLSLLNAELTNASERSLNRKTQLMRIEKKLDQLLSERNIR
jgi:C4-dicarboxylate transporter